jgi:S1-C subfamily serine protease
VASETELQELARRARRRSLESTTAYFAELATDVRPLLGYVPALGTSTVVWDESRAVGGPTPVPDQATELILQTASGERRAEATSSPRMPLSVLKVSVGPPMRVPRRTASVPKAGDWVVAVWQTDHAPAFVAANFRELANTTCGQAQAREVAVNIPLTWAMAGGGVFNMDRELLAAILPCSDHMAAIALSSIDDMLKRIATVEERLLARYGVLFGTLSQEERRYFSGVDGLLVREVWMGTRGDAAGVQPGDVVVALNNHDVAVIDDLTTLTTQSDKLFELSVRRGRSTQIVMLDADAATREISSGVGAHLGLVIESPTPTFRIESVLPDSRAARAGVQAGDVLRRIDQVELRTRTQADRAMRSAASKPILLELERDRRRLAIVIPDGAAR